MTAPEWSRIKERAATDADVRAIVEITLAHATGQVRAAQPAATSRMTFEGGKRRAVSILRNLRSEIRPKTGAQ